MKIDDQLDSQYRAHFGTLMERLLRAGLITSYTEPKEPDDPIEIVWNPDYLEGMGGQAAFFALGALVTSICEEQPLTSDEQEMIEMMHQVLHEQGDEAGGTAA